MIHSLLGMALVIGLVLINIDTMDNKGIRKQVFFMTLPSMICLLVVSLDSACRFIGC